MKYQSKSICGNSELDQAISPNLDCLHRHRLPGTLRSPQKNSGFQLGSRTFSIQGYLEGKVNSCRVASIYFPTDDTVLDLHDQMIIRDAIDLIKLALQRRCWTARYAYVNVVGHSDHRGEKTSNLFLARQRAQTVWKQLRQNSLFYNRIQPKGESEAQKPLGRNSLSLRELAHDRRVDISFTLGNGFQQSLDKRRDEILARLEKIRLILEAEDRFDSYDQMGLFGVFAMSNASLEGYKYSVSHMDSLRVFENSTTGGQVMNALSQIFVGTPLAVQKILVVYWLAPTIDLAIGARDTTEGIILQSTDSFPEGAMLGYQEVAKLLQEQEDLKHELNEILKITMELLRTKVQLCIPEHRQ